MKQPNRIAIIPARGGSKRIANKNIRKIDGLPIIYFILNSAKNSNLFKKIIVSTDSRKIANTVAKLGFSETLNGLRPKAYSTDKAPVYSVVQYEISKIEKFYGLEFDEVWLLSATAALLTSEDLINASKYFLMDDNQALLGVTKSPIPIEWTLTIDKNNRLSSKNASNLKINSQKFKVRYYDSGCLAVFSKDLIKKYAKSVPIYEFTPFKLPIYKGIDVDTEEDFKLVEILSKKKFKSNLSN